MSQEATISSLPTEVIDYLKRVLDDDYFEMIISNVESKLPHTPLPDECLIRLPRIIGDPKAEPPIPPLIPVSKSTWWAGVKDGRFPQPVKLGPRITAWRVSDIRLLIDSETA
jgi:prophage regulatory protein